MEPLIVGRIRKPHGVRGAVIIAVDTDRPERVFSKGKRLALGDARGESVGRSLTLKSVRPTPDAMILGFEGIDDRNDADPLRGHTLLIDASEAEPAGDDEVHYRDLVGLSAVADGATIGRVEEILDLASGRFFVVRDGEGREILVPLVPEMIEAVDPGEGRVVFNLPDGLLEL